MSLSLYVHWPFCKSKCPYCDFNSHVGGGINESEWLSAYLRQLDHFSPSNLSSMNGKKISTIFFGGGTPSLMPPAIAAAIIERASKSFGFTDDVEITFEANPTSIEAAKFQDFRAAGINRVSIGVQALNEADLKFLGREHSASEAIKALEIAANTFDNYSFDLIYARPDQKADAWQAELEQALSFGTKHLSLYQLTIEKGTKFYSQYNAGHFKIPDADTSAELYELTDDIMRSHNMPAYEVSNYAKLGFECRHNLAYWNYAEYIGIGAGAHGRIITAPPIGSKYAEGRRATMMVHAPDAWLKSSKTDAHGLQTDIEITPLESVEEFLMMHIRLFSGIPLAKFQQLFNANYDEVLDAENIKMLAEEGFLEVTSGSNAALKATKSGMMLLQAIIPKLLRSE
jgi:putative oxygen-independent coproporphyrinogen III oxidase